MSNNTLKWYDILNIKQEFFTPIINISKDGIVTVSNLQIIRAGSNILKECFEVERLASTINKYIYSSAEILTLTNNNIFLLYIVTYIISVLLIKKLSNFLENNHSNKKENPRVVKPLSEEDKKSSSSDNNNPNPKGNDTGIIAGILAFMDQHQKALTLIVLGTILVSGTYLVLNHYGMVPDILGCFRSNNGNINENSIIPLTVELINTNNLLAETVNIARFQTEPLPDYFLNLEITETIFEPGLGGFETYAAYKEGLLRSFLQLYEGVNRTIVDITMLTPSILNQYGLIDIYTQLLYELPQGLSIPIVQVQTEIVQGTFREEFFLVERREIIPLMSILMKVLEDAIIHRQLTGL